jgi:hypothetical protein
VAAGLAGAAHDARGSGAAGPKMGKDGGEEKKKVFLFINSIFL